jgi:hypothetical protein
MTIHGNEAHVTISLQLLIILQLDVQEFRLLQIYEYIETVRKAYTGFEDLTAVATKVSVFWDITPCSPLNVLRNVV